MMKSNNWCIRRGSTAIKACMEKAGGCLEIVAEENDGKATEGCGGQANGGHMWREYRALGGR